MTAGNDGIIRGFPFAVKALAGCSSWPGVLSTYSVTFTGHISLALKAQTTNATIRESVTGSAFDNLIVSEWGTGFVNFNVTYLT